MLNIDSIIRDVRESGVDHVRFGGKDSFQGGIHIQQLPDEIGAVIFYLKRRTRINSYLEVGVAAGGLTALIYKYFKPEVITLVDDNKHRKHGLRQRILEGVKRNEIIGDSQDPEVVNKVKALGHSYDVITIDADHTYEGVMKDIKNYANLCNKYLMLHDTIACVGVSKAYEELKSDPRFTFMTNFTTSAYKNPCGIALYRRKPDA